MIALGTRHDVAVKWGHAPQRSHQQDGNQEHGDNERREGPASLGPAVQLQEADHVHDDLHDAQAHDDQGSYSSGNKCV